MFTEGQRAHYHALIARGSFEEARKLVNEYFDSLPDDHVPRRPDPAEPLEVILSIGERMQEYACSEVNAAEIRRGQKELEDMKERLKDSQPPSLRERIRGCRALQEDRYFTLEEIGELVNVDTLGMSNKKVVGQALRDEGFEKVRRRGTYLWASTQRSIA